MARLKHYKDEFKIKIVQLIDAGKKIGDIVSEYGIARRAVNK